jgi:hypothetical protein
MMGNQLNIIGGSSIKFSPYYNLELGQIKPERQLTGGYLTGKIFDETTAHLSVVLHIIPSYGTNEVMVSNRYGTNNPPIAYIFFENTNQNLDLSTISTFDYGSNPQTYYDTGTSNIPSANTQIQYPIIDRTESAWGFPSSFLTDLATYLGVSSLGLNSGASDFEVSRIILYKNRLPDLVHTDGTRFSDYSSIYKFGTLYTSDSDTNPNYNAIFTALFEIKVGGNVKGLLYLFLSENLNNDIGEYNTRITSKTIDSTTILDWRLEYTASGTAQAEYAIEDNLDTNNNVVGALLQGEIKIQSDTTNQNADVITTLQIPYDTIVPTGTGKEGEIQIVKENSSMSLYISDGINYQNIIGSQWSTLNSNIYYNTGNIGIGTTSPIEKLDVNGNIKTNGNLIGNVTGNVTGNITGTVSDISNHDTDALAEGTTNLYHTDSRSRSAISVTDSGGDGSLAYNNTSGVITYTGPSATETRAHFSGGTGVSITNGVVAIGQSVGTSDNVTFNQVTSNLIGNVTGNITGTVSDISNHDTDALAEGTTNLYHTDSRSRSAISVTDSGGDGSLAYNNTSGVITYTGPSATETRAHFSGGTGVSITNGVVAIGQSVGTSDNVTFNQVTSNLVGNVTGNVTGNITGTVSDISNHSINALSDVDTNTTAPTDGQALVWDNANSEWKPGTVASSGGATQINDLSDVDTSTTSPTDGQALVWDSANSEWKPGTVASSGGATQINDLSDVDTSTTSPTDGQALVWDSANSEWKPNYISKNIHSDVTYTVTVGTKTSSHRYNTTDNPTASTNSFIIDTLEAPYLELIAGKTYIFDQSDSTNSGHPLEFYTDAIKTTQYTTGVTVTGTAGTSGSTIELVTTYETPCILYYQCANHIMMGNQVNIIGGSAVKLNSSLQTELNARVDKRVIIESTEPTVADNGALYYDSTSQALKVRYNGSWVTTSSGVGSNGLALGEIKPERSLL